MNILLYAEFGAERQLLMSAFERLGIELPPAVDVWEQLLAQVAVDRPDVAVLSYASLASSGGDAVHTAGLTLKAIGLPVIVSLDAVYSAAAEDITSQTGFDTFVTTPFDEEELAAALTRVTGREVFVRRTTDVTSDFAAVAEEYSEAGMQLSESGDHVVLDPATEEQEPAAPGPVDSGPLKPRVPGAAEVEESPSESEAFFGSRIQPAPEIPAPDMQATEEIQVIADDPFGDDDDDPDFDPFAEALAWSGAQREVASGAQRAPIAMGSGASPATDSGASASSGASRVTGSGAYSSVRAAASSEQRRVFVSGTDGQSTLSDSGAVEASGPPPSGASAAVGSEPAPAPVEAGDTEVRVELPPDAGAIGEIDVPSVLHGLIVRRATGELVLQNESLTRRVVFHDGEMGMVFRPPTADDERKLLSTVGWKGGAFEFVEQDVPEAQFHTFGEALELLFRGVERHIGINELAVALQAQLKQYPRLTDQADRLSRILGLEDVQTFAEASDGMTTLEQRLASAGARTEAVMRHAYFAKLTGGIVFENQPTTGGVRLVFGEAERAAATSRPRIRATASAPPLLDPNRATTTIDVPDAIKEQRKQAPAAGESGAHRATFDRLGQLWTQISSQDAYEVFDLEPGCGAEAVNKRFYELVREYHPDRYARVQSAQIKTLAEKIFLHVRSLHTDLVQREQTGDYARRSTGGFQRSATGNRPSVPEADSGLSPRERRARRRSAASRMAASQSGPQTSVRPTSSGRRVRARGEESGASDAYGRAGQSRAVGESINRLRNRSESTGGPVATPNVTGSQSAVQADHGFTRGTSGSFNTIANSRRLAPDQLLRNAKKSIENGAEDKAWDLLELARVKGLKGHEADAYETYLLARRGELANDAAHKRLAEILDNNEAHRLERSQASMLAGHLARIDEDWGPATKHYEKAAEHDPDNPEAARWLRYVKKKAETDKGKKGGSFLDRLRATLNKKI